MKKILFETDLSKVYILIVTLICIILLGSYFSYAMFTVSKEKSNAISIVTGNLTYDLKVDGVATNKLVIASGETKTFTITLSNPNNRMARFNFYYEGDLADGLTAGYIIEDEFNIPPEAVGINLENEGVGSNQIYIIKVTNSSNKSATINIGVNVGLDYNNLALPRDGHLFKEYMGFPVAEIINHLTSGDTYNDTYDTFITGEDPNNYLWYSGKLWRAVSVNNIDKTVKLITQWDISSFNYNNQDSDSSFAGSYIEEWLNDTSVDGFLGNLRDYENFIVTEAVWDASLDARDLGSITRPSGITTVTDPVGLLNIYEYQTSYKGTTYSNGYLNNKLTWWTLTPYDITYIRRIHYDGSAVNRNSPSTIGVRPAIVLKSNVKIASGDGTINNPYRLNGDNDKNLSGTLLSSRYSGEYLTFGTGENTLYRIVSHETEGLTKITSAEPLKSSGTFITSVFGENITFSSSNTIGTFLNGDYLTNYVGSSYDNMVSESTTWYLGMVGFGTNYKLAKYTDTTMEEYTTSTKAKVGLLRYGELMSGQNDIYENNIHYWLLTPYSSGMVRILGRDGNVGSYPSSYSYGIRPALNLKSNVIITNGDGTKDNPFIIALE